MSSDPRIAFVLDALPSLGGAEKVLFSALDIYPQADVFTLIFNRPVFKNTSIAGRTIHTSYLNSLPLAQKYHRIFLPLMPQAIEQFDLRGYDVIVSFNYAVAHGTRNPDGARHLAYTYTPMRYAWTDLNVNGTQSRQSWIVRHFMDSFRRWDRQASSRVHDFAAISRAVARRIRNAWDRDSRLIYPPVETERFSALQARGDYYVTVTRLVPHKRVDLLVQAFSRLGRRLIVVGDGPEMPRLQAMAGENIHLAGYQTDVRTAELIQEARAFVCAAEEDFGIAIVEAQAAGCPVITYGQGGALESVIEGITGLFFKEQSVESLIDCILKFESCAASFCSDDLVRNADRFGKTRFLQEFRQFVEPTA
jgi:glycosyltransferase involved in cell wall biosynthesis